jgi:hypothetical protein
MLLAFAYVNLFVARIMPMNIAEKTATISTVIIPEIPAIS